MSTVERLSASLAGRYHVLRELGAGGTTIVYLAQDLEHDRKVAVKILHSKLAKAIGAQRFLQELAIAARLQHPHILVPVDSGEANDFLYYVTPYVDGESLRDRLRRSGHLPVPEAVRLLGDIVDALAYAHSQGVLHLDIKPDNVMISGRRALLMDFGIAKAIDEASTRAYPTTGGVAVGTPMYMSPEQAAADPIDHRSDVYAVGAMAYEILTGRPPFIRKSAQATLAAHVLDSPKPLTDLRPTVPIPVSDIVMRCLHKRPDDRWQSAEEIIPALEALATPVEELPSTVEAEAVSTAKPRHRPVVVGIAVVVLVLAVTLLVPRVPDRLTVGQTSQVTLAPELEFDPALSPDGQMIAYAGGRQGEMNVYVRQVSGGRAINLTEGLAGHHRIPEWSPDGAQIAFQSGIAARLSGGRIYVVPARGGTPRLVVDDGAGVAHSPTWSPDGQRIAFVRGDTLFAQTVEGEAPSQALAVASQPHSLAWSTDGARIAFVTENQQFALGATTIGNNAPTGLWILALQSSEVSRVTTENFLYTSPVWLPGDEGLLVLSDRDGPTDMYEIDLNRSVESPDRFHRVTTGLNAHSIALSPFEDRIAYALLAHDANVWAIDIPSSGSVSGTQARPVTSGNQVVGGLDVSRDGAWLVFDANRRGNRDIYRMSIGGGQPEQLTTHPSDDYGPSSSPDGSEIAFYSVRNGNHDIFVMSADGTSRVQVTDHVAHDDHPDWSPDGTALVFASHRTGEREVYVVTRAAGEWSAPRRLTTDGGRYPRWSHDGELVSYVSGASVRVIAPTGGSVSRALVVADPRTGDVPSFAEWSADSRHLYYWVPDAQGRASFWSVPVSGGSPRRLVEFEDAGLAQGGMFATDGRSLYFTTGRAASDLWSMEVTRK